MNSISDLKGIVEENCNRLCKKQNVVGVGVGSKVVDGKFTDEPAILVFVSEKKHEDDLKKRDIIESSIDGIQTDVVGKVGSIQVCVKKRKKKKNPDLTIKALSVIANPIVRPVKAGVSISNLCISAGTLGGFFLDKDGDVVLLSNHHVIAGERMKSQYGWSPEKGNVTIQPGTFDGGNLNHVIAHLKNWAPLKNRGNYEDSAISKIDDLNSIVNEINGLGKVVDFKDGSVGMAVQKVGRTTAHTTGKIISVHTTVCVEYGNITRCFKDCIVTTSMSEGGDSGSLLLDMDMNAVGLLFAGSESVTIYNPISYPVKTYGLKIWRG